MGSNITEQRYSDDNLQLAEPHFNEEATMLSARPVVPLEEIANTNGQARAGKRLAFGLSIVLSLLAGVLVAALIFKQRNQPPAAEIVNGAIPGSGASADESAAPSTGEVKVGIAANAEDGDANKKKTEQIPIAVPIKQQKTQLVRKIPAAVTIEEPDESSYVEDDGRRHERRVEARRFRRMAARDNQEIRGRRRRHSDDLLRVRDIFEGARRP